MDVGQCFEMVVIKQKLQDEGQQHIAFANEARVDNDKDEVQVFTSDAKGDVGYVLSGNQPKSAVSTRGCVALRLQNVKIFDARVPGVDNGTLIKTEDPATARRQCEAVGTGTCGLHSRLLADQDRGGYRVMMQGTVMHHQPDGTYIPGGLVTVTAQMEGEKIGTLGYTSQAGAYTIATAFTDMAYAPYALEILDGRGPMRGAR
jgi:hypothetical protein